MAETQNATPQPAPKDNEPRNKTKMPDVPEMDFVGSLAEIWFSLNCAAYHLAYVRVYLQTGALRTPLSEMAKLEQDLRNRTQADLVICRAHLAAFFWQRSTRKPDISGVMKVSSRKSNRNPHDGRSVRIATKHTKLPQSLARSGAETTSSCSIFCHPSVGFQTTMRLISTKNFKNILNTLRIPGYPLPQETSKKNFRETSSL